MFSKSETKAKAEIINEVNLIKMVEDTLSSIRDGDDLAAVCNMVLDGCTITFLGNNLYEIKDNMSGRLV